MPSRVQKREFIVKAGMTPQDVIKSDKATSAQKRVAFCFDTDGTIGYSKEEADLFNKTSLTDRGENGVSFWTLEKNGNKKETRVSSNELKNFKYNPFKKEVDIDEKISSYGLKAAGNLCYAQVNPITELTEKLHFKDKDSALKYAQTVRRAIEEYEANVGKAVSKKIQFETNEAKKDGSVMDSYKACKKLSEIVRKAKEDYCSSVERMY